MIPGSIVAIDGVYHIVWFADSRKPTGPYSWVTYCDVPIRQQLETQTSVATCATCVACIAGSAFVDAIERKRLRRL